MASALAPPKDGGWPVARAAARCAVPLSAEASLALTTWLDLLATWNARVDLTAARSADELVDLMLADALVLSTRIPLGAHIIDVGTGAGAPGLALAIVRPDLKVTLAEPLSKRAAFLRTVVGTLGLPLVTLDPQKGEVLASSRPEAWDVALARATLPPEPWLALGAQLVRRGGSVWVFLAKESSPSPGEMAQVDEVPYTWPLTGASRRLVRYERRL